jgi:raffinose/stachyose/melibiose transport system substrate-binding protein
MKLRKKLVGVILLAIVFVLSIAGCSAKTKPSDSGQEPGSVSPDKAAKTIKFLSIWAEDQDNSKLIMDLSKRYKEEVNPNFNVDFEFVAANDLVQRVKVLMASNDLPDVFAYESGTPILELIDANAIIDVEKTFKDLGIYNSLDEGAVSLLKNLAQGRGLYAAPLGLNIEGFWYNKALFARAGIEKEPETWDEFMQACDKLKAADIQPITAGGKDKWPLTRVLNALVFRSMGVDAMRKASEGKMSFNDEGFVEAATTVQDMAKQGYFGKGVVTVDMGTAQSMLMNGQAGMLYNGSWFIQNLNNKEQNVAGPDGIGFFNVPLVTGGPGKMDEYSMNCGNILAFSSKKYDAVTGEWMKYVFSRIGDYSMDTYGSFKGYKINKMPENIPSYTKLVGDQLAAAKGSTLWFEASFDAKTSKTAQDNIQALINGEMSPEDYMSHIEKSIAEYRAANR